MFEEKFLWTTPGLINCMVHAFEISHLHVNDSLQVVSAARFIWSFVAKPLICSAVQLSTDSS